MSASKNIILLLRLEYLRWRRGRVFSYDAFSQYLTLALWIIISISVPHFLEQTGQEASDIMPALLLADQLLRWISQKTPSWQPSNISLLPIRKWQYTMAYLVRMIAMPISFVWIPAIWPRWWLLGLFLLDGYVYLALWHFYKQMILSVTNNRLYTTTKTAGRGLLSCEMKMRLRHHGLRTRIINGLLSSLLLSVLCTVVDSPTYTDFAVLYTLTFASLPLLTAKFGYEQNYMSLLATRLHGFGQVYRAKYIAAILWMLPGLILLTLPIMSGILTATRLVGWTLFTALLLYPALLLMAPKTPPGSPTAQVITLLTLTIPVFVAGFI